MAEVENMEKFLIEQFKALRDESLRSAQLLSNAVWIAVTGFGVTIGAGAAFLGKNSSGSLSTNSMLLPFVTTLLCIQSVAISIMYLSELWKYVRVGAYICDHVEVYFGARSDTNDHWEHWIKNHRATALYIAAIGFLQIPFIVLVLSVIVLMCIPAL